MPGDVLAGAVAPGDGPGRRSRARTVGVAAGALLAAVAGAGAVYAGTALGGGGSQPEDVLPRTAIGFVKLDLDPSAGQKLAAYRLARTFPDSGVRGQDDVKGDVLKRLFEDSDIDVDADLSPWLGDRAGVAVLPPRGDEPVVVAALQVTDAGEAEKGLTALAQRQQEDGEQLHWALTENEDYALLSDDRAAVEDAAREQQHLAGNPRFVRGVEALGDDTLALAWVDLTAVWAALPEQVRSGAVAGQPDVEVAGLMVAGARVADDHVELSGRTVDLSFGSSPELQALVDTSVQAGPADLVQGLPGDSLGTFGVSGLGEGLARLYETVDAEHPEELREVQPALDELGLSLPGDLRTLLGSQLAASVSGEPADGKVRVLARVRTDDGARAVDLLRRATADLPVPDGGLDVRATEGGYTVEYDATGGVPPSAGVLRDSDLFRRTVPDADRSGMTYYVDLGRLLQSPALQQDLTERQRRNLAPLRAVGSTVVQEEAGEREGGGYDSAFRLRLTVE